MPDMVAAHAETNIASLENVPEVAGDVPNDNTTPPLKRARVDTVDVVPVVAPPPAVTLEIAVAPQPVPAQAYPFGVFDVVSGSAYMVPQPELVESMVPHVPVDAAFLNLPAASARQLETMFFANVCVSCLHCDWEHETYKMCMSLDDLLLPRQYDFGTCSTCGAGDKPIRVLTILRCLPCLKSAGPDTYLAMFSAAIVAQYERVFNTSKPFCALFYSDPRCPPLCMRCVFAK